MADEQMNWLRNVGIEKIPMDHRADHEVWTNGNVKFPYKGYMISVAADGADVLIFDPYTSYQAKQAATSAESIANAVAYINHLTGENEDG